MLKYYFFCDNIRMRFCNANLYKEVKTMPKGNNGTWDSDYAFIYEFIEILERIFEMIANFFNSLGGGSTTAPDNGAAAN